MVNYSNLIYAKKGDEIVSVDDVESGLACGCTCPACGEKLVAKKGDKRTHHFAHYSKKDCEYGYESSLHLAAKDILSKANRFVIPAVYVEFPSTNKSREIISEACEITVDKVELEKRFDNIIPDVVIYSGNKQFFVEIYVTHKVDDEKREIIKKANCSTIEIDLSKKDRLLSREEISNLLLSDCPEKKWIHNSIENKYLNKFYKYGDYRPVVTRGVAEHVDNCPLKTRWYGKYYANFFDDCLGGCKYCLLVEDGGVLCSGRRRVATIKDFEIPEEERLKINENEPDPPISEDLKMVYNGMCPACNGKLVKRNGRNGVFLGCSNYPKCRFTASCFDD